MLPAVPSPHLLCCAVTVTTGRPLVVAPSGALRLQGRGGNSRGTSYRTGDVAPSWKDGDCLWGGHSVVHPHLLPCAQRVGPGAMSKGGPGTVALSWAAAQVGLVVPTTAASEIACLVACHVDWLLSWTPNFPGEPTSMGAFAGSPLPSLPNPLRVGSGAPLGARRKSSLRGVLVVQWCGSRVTHSEQNISKGLPEARARPHKSQAQRGPSPAATAC